MTNQIDEIKIKVYQSLFPNFKFLPKIKGEDLDNAIELTYKYCLETIAPRSNSPSASAEAEDLICVKEEFQK
jgi:hypothetical protein